MRSREQLIRQRVLATQDNQWKLLQDDAFQSQTHAAGRLFARIAHGRLDWKDAVDFSDLQAQ